MGWLAYIAAAIAAVVAGLVFLVCVITVALGVYAIEEARREREDR
jgi:hypothetical protein